MLLRGNLYILNNTIQSLLSILKHRTIEKTVDRCELSIVEGVLPAQGADYDDGDEDRDSLESKLIVRLHCKHGESYFHF
jgi:cell cycle checkpoint control protein RAD9A